MRANDHTLHFEVHQQPNLELAQAATSVGHNAWMQRFVDEHGSRTATEIDYTFNQHSATPTLEKMIAAHGRTNEFGRFAGVVALANRPDGLTPVGVIWGADDVTNPTNDLFEYKERFEQGKVYACVAQQNVLPHSWRNRGIGSGLLAMFLNQFAADQKTTAYVFEENQPSIDWFINRGYALTDASQYIKEYDFFGPGTTTVVQRRLVAPVSLVLAGLETP